MGARALVTGAGGFVGAHLSRHLESEGWEVIRFIQDGPCDMERTVACDFTYPRMIAAVLHRLPCVTHVFHLAAISWVPGAAAKPTQTVESNLLGTMHLIEHIRRHSPEARFLHVGSGAVYGAPTELPVTEASPLAPATLYGITKAAADQYCACLHEADGFDVLRMRPFNHSGPGQSDAFVLSSFARQVALIEAGKREPVLTVGNLETARDFLHVEDVVRAYRLAAVSGQSGEAYNVCSGEAHQIGKALEALLAHARVDIEIRVDPERVRKVDVPMIYGSHAKFSAATGWAPSLPFDQILRDLLEYWRDVEGSG